MFKESPEQILESLKARYNDQNKFAASVALPNTEKPGYSHIYRNASDPKTLVSCPHPELDTLHKIFEFSSTVYPDKPFLGHRVKNPDGTFGNYTFETYKQIRQRRNHLGSGIYHVLENSPYKTSSKVHSNLKYDPAKKDPFVLAVFSHNRPEWALCDITANSYGIVSTALYITLGHDSSKFILGATDCPIVVTTKDRIESLINLKNANPKELSDLITIVSMDELTAEDEAIKSKGHENNISIYSIKEVEKFGEQNPLDPIPPTPDTVFTISFTSGTTGAAPKGVVLTNRNLTSGVATHCTVLGYGLDRVHYSFLPLAHIYERMLLQFGIISGTTIGYPQGPSPTTIFEDIRFLQPTMLCLVPRVFTKLEAIIKAQTIDNDADPKMKAAFTDAINKKMKLQQEKDFTNPSNPAGDMLLAKLRDKLGLSKVKFVTSGSAPLSKETFFFLQAALNLPEGFRSGYGLTESVSGISASPAYVNQFSCGPISFTSEMKLRDIPDMGYTANDEVGPRGELLLRGPQLFSHYYKNPEETAKAIDEDGWFHTGDVAAISSKDGNRIQIVDRVKNFFKLSQGEYVSPEKIEGIYLSQFPFISQLFVHGNSTESCLVAIVGIDKGVVDPYMKKRFDMEVDDPANIVKFFEDPINRRSLLQDMNKYAGGQLNGFEKLHNVFVDFEPLTIEKGVITPTIKNRRPMCAKVFKPQIDSMYAEGSLLKNTKL